MKIEIGAGTRPQKPDFFQVDIRPVAGVNLVCNAWELHQHLPVASAEMIYNRHMFEHLTFDQGKRAVESWLKVLKPGGLIEMMTPDLAFHCQQFLDPEREQRSLGPNKGSFHEHSLAGFYGKQRDSEQDELWDVHKSGYDFAGLRAVLEWAGFKDITKVNDQPWHLHVIAMKP